MNSTIQAPDLSFSFFDMFVGTFFIIAFLGLLGGLLFYLFQQRFKKALFLIFDNGIIYKKQFFLINDRLVEYNLLAVLLKREKTCGLNIRDYPYFFERNSFGGLERVYLAVKMGADFYIPVRVSLSNKQLQIINDEAIANRLYDEAINYFITSTEQVKAIDQLMARIVESVPIVFLAVSVGALFWLSASILHDNYTAITQANKEISENLLLASNISFQAIGEAKNVSKNLENYTKTYQDYLESIKNLSISGGNG